MEPDSVIEQMGKIIEAYPASLDYSEDGRYTWPDRWDALLVWLIDNKK